MLTVEERQSVLFVTLDRPDVRNAFHPELIKKLTEVFISADKRKHLRAVVLRGSGKVFCAGADLTWMKEMAKYSQKENLADSENLFEMFESIRTCSVPVITLVHGAAFGGALGLIAASDYVIADTRTQLCFSEVKIGLLPAVISAFIMRKVSQGSIGHLMMSGQVFYPSAVAGTLVHQIIDLQGTDPMQGLEAAAAGILLSLHESAPESVRETKKLLNSLQELDWKKTKKKVCETIAERRVSKEGQEGLASFFAKQKPSWVPEAGKSS